MNSHVVACRSIKSGSLAVSTQLKLQSLMRVGLIARMGQEYVMQHVLHRFKSVFFDSSTVLFRQGDVIQESSAIYILANGRVKVLVDPQFKIPSDENEEVRMAATTEATGARYATPSALQLGCALIFSTIIINVANTNK